MTYNNNNGGLTLVVIVVLVVIGVLFFFNCGGQREGMTLRNQYALLNTLHERGHPRDFKQEWDFSEKEGFKYQNDKVHVALPGSTLPGYGFGTSAPFNIPYSLFSLFSKE